MRRRALSTTMPGCSSRVETELQAWLLLSYCWPYTYTRVSLLSARMMLLSLVLISVRRATAWVVRA